jgi:hypothetical protein
MCALVGNDARRAHVEPDPSGWNTMRRALPLQLETHQAEQ